MFPLSVTLPMLFCGGVATNAAGLQKYITAKAANAPPARRMDLYLTSKNPGRSAATPPAARARRTLNTVYWNGVGAGKTIASTSNAAANATPKAKMAMHSQTGAFIRRVLRTFVAAAETERGRSMSLRLCDMLKRFSRRAHYPTPTLNAKSGRNPMTSELAITLERHACDRQRPGCRGPY